MWIGFVVLGDGGVERLEAFSDIGDRHSRQDPGKRLFDGTGNFDGALTRPLGRYPVACPPGRIVGAGQAWYRLARPLGYIECPLLLGLTNQPLDPGLGTRVLYQPDW